MITQKHADYIIFKKIYELIKNKKHLTEEEVDQILAFKASINLGLSDNLKKAFPYIKPVTKDLVTGQEIMDPNWVAGFTSGVYTGSFYIRISKNSTLKIGHQVQLVLQITQDIRDLSLLESLRSYLNCGKIRIRKYNNIDHDSCADLIVTNLIDINEKILPFFNVNKIIGVKLQDYNDWCKAAILINNKEHLTSNDLDKIFKLKEGMNKGRVYSL